MTKQEVLTNEALVSAEMNGGEIDVTSDVEVEVTDRVIPLQRVIVENKADGKRYNDLFVMVTIAGKERKASCVLRDKMSYQFIDAVFGNNKTVDMEVGINKIKDNVTGKITKSLNLTIGFEEDGFRFNIPVKPVTVTDREIINFYCKSKLGLNL